MADQMTSGLAAAGQGPATAGGVRAPMGDAREGRQQARMARRLDVLVSDLEAVAERISRGDVSTSQKTALIAEFNDLERQVNQLDGIVAGEGQEASGGGKVASAGISRGIGRGGPGELGQRGSRDAAAALRRVRQTQGESRTSGTTGAGRATGDVEMGTERTQPAQGAGADRAREATGSVVDLVA